MLAIVFNSRPNVAPRQGNNVLLALIVVVVACGLVDACLVDSVCYNNADCPDGQACLIEKEKSNGTCRSMCRDDGDCPAGYLCDRAQSFCQEAECLSDSECSEGFKCEDGCCESLKPLQCPAGMVPVERRFCVDVYESSRPDATSSSSGSDSSLATSRPNVLPWQVKDNAEAAQACLAAGKSLCSEDQWYKACTGPANTVYSYGDEYDVLSCNGIDTYCDCGPTSSCGSHDPCPYPYCYRDCGAWFILQPTGSFTQCTNGYGVFDINGNLWEHVLDGDETRIRGGAYNCSDSKKLHRCDYIPSTWKPSARGFRCCSPGWIDEDAGSAGASHDGGGV